MTSSLTPSETPEVIDRLRLSAEAAQRGHHGFWRSLSCSVARQRVPRHAASPDRRFRTRPAGHQDGPHAALFKGYAVIIRNAFHRWRPTSRSGWARLACSTLACSTRHPCRPP
jgi:hypothetical protein